MFGTVAMFVIGEICCNVCDCWSLLQCLWLVKFVAMFVTGEVCWNVSDWWNLLQRFWLVKSVATFLIGEICQDVCDRWSLLQCFWLVKSVKMFVISEVCCNFCDWWRMENQKLHKQPSWISLIIDGINIQNLGRWPPNDYLGPNSVSFHPVVQKIYNNFLCLINLADSEM